MSHFARGGEIVVPAQSDYSSLGVYAVRASGGSLRLLLINKHPSARLDVSIPIQGLRKGQKARVYSYGIPQDEAARTGEGSADVQQSKFVTSGSTLTYSPEPYSATVIDVNLSGT